MASWSSTNAVSLSDPALLIIYEVDGPFLSKLLLISQHPMANPVTPDLFITLVELRKARLMLMKELFCKLVILYRNMTSISDFQ